MCQFIVTPFTFSPWLFELRMSSCWWLWARRVKFESEKSSKCYRFDGDVWARGFCGRKKIKINFCVNFLRWQFAGVGLFMNQSSHFPQWHDNLEQTLNRLSFFFCSFVINMNSRKCPLAMVRLVNWARESKHAELFVIKKEVDIIVQC